jgi:hypothetical protein
MTDGVEMVPVEPGFERLLQSFPEFQVEDLESKPLYRLQVSHVGGETDLVFPRNFERVG